MGEIMSKKKLEIVYNINAGIPFKWEYEIKDNSICELANIKSKGEKTKEPICGGNIENIYILLKELNQEKQKFYLN